VPERVAVQAEAAQRREPRGSERERDQPAAEQHADKRQREQRARQAARQVEERPEIFVRVVRDARGLEAHAGRARCELDRLRHELRLALGARRFEQRPREHGQLVEAAVAQRVRRRRHALRRGQRAAALGLGQRTRRHDEGIRVRDAGVRPRRERTRRPERRQQRQRQRARSPDRGHASPFYAVDRLTALIRPGV
jgi:hypothetical protein